MKGKKINHIEKNNYMGSLLNSLVVLTLLFGLIAATTTAAARPSTISRFGSSSRALRDGGDDSEEEFHPNGMNRRFFNRFPGFWFRRQKQQPEEPAEEKARPIEEEEEEEKVAHRNEEEEEEEEKVALKNEEEEEEKLVPRKRVAPKNEEEEVVAPKNEEEVAVPEDVGQRAGPVANGIGSWKIDSENAGVSAMHIQLMPNNNKAVWFDSTSNGLSEIQLNPRSCKPRFGGRQNDPEQDCTAHAVEYDVENAAIRPLKMDFSPWCSSGGLSLTGNLISTGGDKDGLRAVRMLQPCPTCRFRENPKALYTNRWYATQHTLEDGTFILVGGRNAYNYEIIQPDTITFTPKLVGLPLLEETSDDGGRENNLYPFINLLPDGNLFVFANYKSIILDPATGKTVRNLPDLAGGSRNYPASGMSALLPIDMRTDDTLDLEVLVCGGNTREAYTFSDLQQPKRTFLEASKTCGRLKVDVEGAEWEMEEMPSPRVMGDMLLLPNGDILILNGAKAGTSAWDAADIPNLTPVLYSPYKKNGERFRELAPTAIPRMYHSVSAVLPDGNVLVAGSNTNAFYKLKKYNDQYKFPTELRVEKFSPPYLAPELDKYHIMISEVDSQKELTYGAEFTVFIKTKGLKITTDDIRVTMYSPPFTTHGYSMNQRLLILKVRKLRRGRVTVVAPPSGNYAPPGYYLLFVVYGDVPSRGMWVHIK